jgi:hypothetical protein
LRFYPEDFQANGERAATSYNRPGEPPQLLPATVGEKLENRPIPPRWRIKRNPTRSQLPILRKGPFRTIRAISTRLTLRRPRSTRTPRKRNNNRRRFQLTNPREILRGCSYHEQSGCCQVLHDARDPVCGHGGCFPIFHDQGDAGEGEGGHPRSRRNSHLRAAAGLRGSGPTPHCVRKRTSGPKRACGMSLMFIRGTLRLS